MTDFDTILLAVSYSERLGIRMRWPHSHITLNDPLKSDKNLLLNLHNLVNLTIHVGKLFVWSSVVYYATAPKFSKLDIHGKRPQPICKEESVFVEISTKNSL